MKPRFLTVLLCALLGLVLWLMSTQWLPWLGTVRVAGESHFGPATTVVAVLLLAAIAVSSVSTTWFIRHRERLGTLPPFGKVLQFMGIVFIVLLLTGASFVAPIAGAFTKAVYVSEGGNLTAAKNAAVAGDTIFVGPGTYYNCTNLAKNGVNWIGHGATLTMTNVVGDGGFGIIDDRRQGAIRTSFIGFSYIYSSGNTTQNGSEEIDLNGYPTNAIGMVVSTNPTTRIVMSGDSVNFSLLGGNGGKTVFWIADGTNSYFKFNEVVDAWYHTNHYIGTNTILEENVYDSSGAAVIYWDKGDVYFDIGLLKSRYYAIYCLAATTNTSGNLWYNGDLIIGKIYISANTIAPWKMWFNFKELRMETNAHIATPFNVVSDLHATNGAKVYATFQKIGSTEIQSPTIDLRGGSEVWLTGQKVSGVSTLFSVKGCRTIASIQHGELSGFGNGIDADSGDYGGGTVSNVTFRLTGMTLRTTNGLAVRGSIGAEMQFQGCRFEQVTVGASASNSVVLVRTNGTVFESCVLIGRTTNWTIRAAVTNSVLAYNTVCNNPNTNVLIQVGPLTVDPLVR